MFKIKKAFALLFIIVKFTLILLNSRRGCKNETHSFYSDFGD